jgi:hypothetical protein
MYFIASSFAGWSPTRRTESDEIDGADRLGSPECAGLALGDVTQPAPGVRTAPDGSLDPSASAGYPLA